MSSNRRQSEDGRVRRLVASSSVSEPILSAEMLLSCSCVCEGVCVRVCV